MVFIKGDWIFFDLADIVVAVSRAESVTRIDYSVFITILLFLESVPDVLVFRLGVVVNSSMKPSRDMLVISYPS
jgi:hypothetical protein